MLAQKKALSTEQGVSPPTTERDYSKLVYLVGLGALLGVWFLGLFVVSALDSLGFPESPVTERWPWLLLPARWIFPASDIDGGFDPSNNKSHFLLLALVFCGVVLTSVAAYSLARHMVRPQRRHLLVVVVGVLVFGTILLFLPFFPSPDIFSYIFYGRISVLYHANPLIAVPSQYPADPFLSTVLEGWRSTPSVYGPVWEGLADGLTWLAQSFGGSLLAYVLLFKGLTLLFHLANVLVIWRILGVLAPRRRVAGVVLYAWNPLALLEFAGAGHNDVVMLFFLLLGVLFLIQKREVLALLAFALAIDTKYIPLLVLPFYLWYVLRDHPGWLAKVRGAAWRGGVLVGVCALCYLPYWAGLHTLDSLLFSSTVRDLYESLAEVVATAIRRGLEVTWHWSDAQSSAIARLIVKPICTLLFLVLWFRQFPRARTRQGLLDAWWWALFFYLVIASGWFLPWYVTWLVAVAALRPLDELADATLLLAGGVLLFHVLDVRFTTFLHGSRAVLAFGPAILYLLWCFYRAKRRARQEAARPLQSLGKPGKMAPQLLDAP